MSFWYSGSDHKLHTFHVSTKSTKAVQHPNECRGFASLVEEHSHPFGWCTDWCTPVWEIFSSSGLCFHRRATSSPRILTLSWPHHHRPHVTCTASAPRHSRLILSRACQFFFSQIFTSSVTVASSQMFAEHELTHSRRISSNALSVRRSLQDTVRASVHVQSVRKTGFV